MAPLFLLSETSAGYALLKASKGTKLLKKTDLEDEISTVEGINELLKLKSFSKFDSAATALEEVAALVDGKVSPMLSELLSSLKDETKASLAVADPKLGAAINKIPGLSLTPISDSITNDIFRGIRNNLSSLIPGLEEESIATMSLGLSHSLSRHKLRFSPDKVDTMIVQAIALLDDLDKELNTYAMRVKEWYGWHFPEMGKIVNDNLAYARIILKIGMRQKCSNSDLSDILPEEIETAIKAAAEVSMGTEITEEDLENIQLLAEQVIGFTEYRQQLSSYLTARMNAIAPNLTEMVGELVGARLIAHSGSLMNLAKSPASTIQILGAEKALFRALKTKHDTPKYGLIYHASLVGQATGKNKGKIARMLAAKAAIGIRVDALSDWSAQGEGKGDDIEEEERSALGVASRIKIERHLRVLEGKPIHTRATNVNPNVQPLSTPGKWEVKEARKYNADADGLDGDEPGNMKTTSEKNSKDKLHESGKKTKKINYGEKKPLIEEIKDDDDLNKDVDMADENSVQIENLPQSNSKPKTGSEKKRRKSTSEKTHSNATPSRSGDAAEDLDVKRAEAAGLSLKRYKKKLAKGEIEFNADGTPVVSNKKSKKEKDQSEHETCDTPSRKRKSTEDEKPEKKKKKKSKDQ
ncbi:Nucleolar protein 58 [Golovinomyces cichoracearum]|uniref:Nucleolar protein 58 n=1 Tax=Golovinomyces cichoracearum TaxID=62708 RepID=A0A420J824_9PEZI|nr:Nucleolar protein 58 [Golovinomyces cichoracearum]